MSLDEILSIDLDPSIRAVVLGHDKNFTYRKLCMATTYLRDDPTRLLLASNPDDADLLGIHASTGRSRFMPGTGALLKCIEAAASRRAVIAGKGGDFLLPFLLRQYQLNPATTAVIGDRLDTDIALGKQGDMKTVLVLSGVASMRDVEAAREEDRPDVIIPCLGALIGK